jgi:putative ABC transport system permease protein
VLVLFEAFGLVALLLAAIGIYGILSGSVTERTREIGVRAALGATRADILALVLRQGMTMTASASPSVSAQRWSRPALSILHALRRLLARSLTYLGALLLSVFRVGIACLIPARRAASIDPMQALRTE